MFFRIYCSKLQKGAFLCAESGVNLSITLTKKFGAGLFGGEGFILQDISGKGMAFLEVDGDTVEKELQPGEVILVDTGNVVAFDKTCSYEVTTVKGVKNVDKSCNSSEFQQRGQQCEPVERQYPFAERVVQS